MLSYINESFLHAPSTDLSRDVVKFMTTVILAQASEVFYEKCVDEKKSNALLSKVGAQVAFMYNSLNEEVKEFMGKGIFDRNWVTLIQVRTISNSRLFMFNKQLRLRPSISPLYPIILVDWRTIPPESMVTLLHGSFSLRQWPRKPLELLRHLRLFS